MPAATAGTRRQFKEFRIVFSVDSHESGLRGAPAGLMKGVIAFHLEIRRLRHLV